MSANWSDPCRVWCMQWMYINRRNHSSFCLIDGTHLHALGVPPPSSTAPAFPFPSSWPSTKTIPAKRKTTCYLLGYDSRMRWLLQNVLSNQPYPEISRTHPTSSTSMLSPFLKEDLFKVIFRFRDRIAKVALCPRFTYNPWGEYSKTFNDHI